MYYKCGTIGVWNNILTERRKETMPRPCYLNFKVDVKNRKRYCEIICERLGIPFDVNTAIDFALAQVVFMAQTLPNPGATDVRTEPAAPLVSQPQKQG